MVDMDRKSPGEFEIQVRTALIRSGYTLGQLYEMIKDRTGLYCDNSYLHKIFINPKIAPKIRAAIAEILEIEITEGPEA